MSFAAMIPRMTYGDLVRIAEASPAHRERPQRAAKLVGVARDWAHVNGTLATASEERIEQFDRLLDWAEGESEE